jgi:hypothetical protein
MITKIKTIRINTVSLSEAICAIWNFISDHEICDLNFVDRFVLSNGRKFKWEPTLAHYFQTKGRLSEQDFCLACEILETNIHFSPN